MANKEQGYGRYKGRVAHTKRRIGGAKLAGGAGGGEVRSPLMGGLPYLSLAIL